jgi:hypothetical protein
MFRDKRNSGAPTAMHSIHLRSFSTISCSISNPSIAGVFFKVSFASLLGSVIDLVSFACLSDPSANLPPLPFRAATLDNAGDEGELN